MVQQPNDLSRELSLDASSHMQDRSGMSRHLSRKDTPPSSENGESHSHIELPQVSQKPLAAKPRSFQPNMLYRLVNDQNANNCFINVVVQNLWHLTGFQQVLKAIILAANNINKAEHEIVYELARLLKSIKESQEGSIHSVFALKQAVLAELFGAGAYGMNDQADAIESFMLILQKVHEYFKGSQQGCSCHLHSACQLTLQKRIICRWPNCQGVKNFEMDPDVFQQLCYMRPWLDFVQNQEQFVQQKYGYAYRKNFLQEIKLVRGQFFQVFKVISRDLSAVKCPKECGQEEALDIQLVLKKPFPNLLLFNFVWDQQDCTATNSLMVMASLPWEGFVPNFYTEENMQDEAIFKTVYKLQSIVLYTGNHYFTIVRISSTISDKKKAWHLLNDEEVRTDGFEDWQDVIQFILQSKCVPTMVIYQKRTLRQPATDRRDLIRPQATLTPDQLDILFCTAKETDEVDGLIENNQELQQQQDAIMKQIREQQKLAQSAAIPKQSTTQQVMMGPGEPSFERNQSTP